MSFDNVFYVIVLSSLSEHVVIYKNLFAGADDKSDIVGRYLVWLKAF